MTSSYNSSKATHDLGILSTLLTRYEIEKGSILDALEEQSLTADKLWGQLLSKDPDCECEWKQRTHASCAQCVNLRRMGPIGSHSFDLNEHHFEIVRERITSDQFISPTDGLGVIHGALSVLKPLVACQPNLQGQLQFLACDPVSVRVLTSLILSRDDLMTAFVCGREASYVYSSPARAVTEADIPAVVEFFKRNEQHQVSIPEPSLMDLQVRTKDSQVVARCSKVQATLAGQRVFLYDQEAQNFVASMTTLEGVGSTEYVIGLENLNKFLAMRRMGLPVLAGSFDLYVIMFLLLAGKKKAKHFKKTLEALFPDKELRKQADKFLETSHTEQEVYEFLSEVSLQCRVLQRM